MGTMRSATSPALSTGNDKTNTFGYDALNRLLSMALSDGKSVAYTYDAVGNRLTMLDWRGTTTYSYDLLNRITSVQTPDWQDGWLYLRSSRQSRQPDIRRWQNRAIHL